VVLRRAAVGGAAGLFGCWSAVRVARAAALRVSARVDPPAANALAAAFASGVRGVASLCLL
ncbi:MAG: hypothetical protein ABSB24_14920, partial [Gaiellaceae bacterium]